MEKVGIIGVAQTKYEAKKPRQDFAELVFEVVERVREETGLKFVDDGTGIDATVSCNQDLWDGRMISTMGTQDVTGGHHRTEESVKEDGAHAIAYAVMQILSGHHDTVLVVSHCKESQTDARLIENAGFDPFYERTLGLDQIVTAALQAKRYMYKYGVTREQCAKVVVKNRGNARNNPYAQEPLDLAVGDVLNSKMLAHPITVLDSKPVSDGACAIILAREDKAKKWAKKPVWVKGFGVCNDTHFVGYKDLADCEALSVAAQKAYRLAGIANPLKDIDVAEISEFYSYQELLWMEGLGFCERGGAGKLVDEGTTRMGGELPVNPSGGVLAGNPISVAGMARVAEAVLQLQGKAGARQVERARTALAHGVLGPCGQTHCVLILGA